MKTPEEDRPDHMPTVSGPAPRQEKALSLPPPKIKGYEIVSELGEAGQGQVWRAVQLSTHREVALKIPRSDLLRSRKALARFEREVELAARLRHVNIARIYDSGISEGLYYYTMELIEGTPLDEYVERHELSTEEIVELMRVVCAAVQHAHQNGVIHRDIKPSNILVTQDGQPHVVDFGLAMSMVEDNTFRTLSTDGEVTGTPAYMSPEQAAGHHQQLDTRTDVYSLGVVLYELLTGSLPYDVNTSMVQTLQNIRDSDPIRPRRLLRSLDRDIEAIILKTLAKEPDARYQSVAELRHDIERWLADWPILARSDSSLYLLRKVLARHCYTSTVVGLLVVGVFVLVCGYVLKTWFEETTRYAELAVFGQFLNHWHDDRPEQGPFPAVSFAEGTREAKAARFLRDERPLTEKMAEIKQTLEKSEPCFMWFIIAEHHLKDGDRVEATRAYRTCLSHADSTEENQLLLAWVRSRLYELTNDDANPRAPARGGARP